MRPSDDDQIIQDIPDDLLDLINEDDLVAAVSEDIDEAASLVNELDLLEEELAK